MGGANTRRLPAYVQESLRCAVAKREAGASVWEWFDHRVRSSREARASLPWQRLNPDESQAAYQVAMAAPAGDENRVAYVHIPYCHQQCTFCGYAREIVVHRKTGERYATALRRQIDCLGAAPWVYSRPFQAVYFGGGTPTALGVDVLAGLVADFRAALPLTRDAEITVETSITDIDVEGLADLRAAGVNRVSFGVQTFDTRLRRSLGRSADREMVLRRLEEAGLVGFDGVCADLMYHLPGQTNESWRRDIDLMLKTPVNGLSLYPLVLFPGSALAASGYSYPTHATQQEYQAFTYADDILGGLSWRRLTPVQYSVGQQENAVYVSAHGRGSEVLAFGAGGVGRVGTLTYWHTHNPDDFADDWAGPGPVSVTCLVAPPAYVLNCHWHQLSESLRLARQDSAGHLTVMDALVEALIRLGLVDVEGDDWALTMAGRFWAGNIGEMMSLVIREQETAR